MPPNPARERQMRPRTPEEERCSICAQPFTTPCTLFPCQHPFDFHCIITWLEHIFQTSESEFLELTCPLCRQTTYKILQRGAEKSIDVGKYILGLIGTPGAGGNRWERVEVPGTGQYYSDLNEGPTAAELERIAREAEWFEGLALQMLEDEVERERQDLEETVPHVSWDVDVSDIDHLYYTGQISQRERTKRQYERRTRHLFPEGVQSVLEETGRERSASQDLTLPYRPLAPSFLPWQARWQGNVGR